MICGRENFYGDPENNLSSNPMPPPLYDKNGRQRVMRLKRGTFFLSSPCVQCPHLGWAKSARSSFIVALTAERAVNYWIRVAILTNAPAAFAAWLLPNQFLKGTDFCF